MSNLITRDHLDLMTPVERQNSVGSMLGVGIAKAVYDVKQRIDSFHLLIESEIALAARKYPNSPEHLQQAKAFSMLAVGDELQRTTKMLESLVNQYIKMGGVQTQDTIHFAIGILQGVGFTPIPDEVYKAHQDSLDKACSEYFSRKKELTM